MSKNSPIASSLRSLLDPLSDPVTAEKQKRYLKNRFPFLGVKVPVVRTAVKQLAALHPSQDWKAEVEDLWAQPEREFHLAAIFWAHANRKKALKEDLSFYQELIASHSWWDTVDFIAANLAGLLIRKFPLLIPKTEDWLHSSHLWLRRSAIIYQLRWKKDTDEARLFNYCSALAHEKEFFIRKAIGWALREYSKTNSQAVARFVDKAPLSPLSQREARKYL